jgi:hypothetical protein
LDATEARQISARLAVGDDRATPGGRHHRRSRRAAKARVGAADGLCCQRFPKTERHRERRTSGTRIPPFRFRGCSEPDEERGEDAPGREAAYWRNWLGLPRNGRYRMVPRRLCPDCVSAAFSPGMWAWSWGPLRVRATYDCRESAANRRRRIASLSFYAFSFDRPVARIHCLVIATNSSLTWTCLPLVK